MRLRSRKKKFFKTRGMAACLRIDGNDVREGRADDGAYTPEKQELTSTERHKTVLYCEYNSQTLETPHIPTSSFLATNCCITHNPKT